MHTIQWSKTRSVTVSTFFFDFVWSKHDNILYFLMQMSPEDFISNNRGIDDGKDLPEEYLRALYERISRNEIKMKEDELVPNKKQSTNSNKILGLDSILNIVIRKRDAPLETSDDLVRHMQEQFKEKARKTE